MYKLTKEGYMILRTTDGAYIPVNPDNTDYQAYLKWVSEGGVPTPADEASPTAPASSTTI
jgi:hypothetical protein